MITDYKIREVYMPITLIGLVVGVILLAFGFKQEKRLFKIAGLLCIALVISFWVVFLLGNR